MSNSIVIEKFTISGFRAFLKEQTFTLFENNIPKGLAIFAPNAKGKSSLVDAIEFFFSQDGTLKRLGQRRSGTQAGREALEHFKAKETNIPTKVSIYFRSLSDKFGDTRNFSQFEQPRPDAANRVVESRKIDFIIRGHELRKFVDDETPQDRYQEISEWFGLSSLTDIQKNVRDLRLSINKEITEDRATAERLRDLRRITNNNITTWDETETLKWVNKILIIPLKTNILLTELNKSNQSYKLLQTKKDEEEKRIGISALNQVSESIKKLFEKDVLQSDGSTKDTGAIVSFEEAVKVYSHAIDKKNNEQSKAERAIFKDIWDAAKQVFENRSIAIEVCPICTTPLSNTAMGSRDHITLHLQTERNNLKAYSLAVETLEKVTLSLQREVSVVRTAISNLRVSLKSADLSQKTEIVDKYSTLLDTWELNQIAPDSLTLKSFLSNLLVEVGKDVQQILDQQGEYTYANALLKIDELIELKVKLEEIRKIKSQLQIIHDRLITYETFLSGKIRDYGQSVINTLQKATNTLYGSVHVEETDVPKIHLELPLEPKQPYLNLLIDFAPNRLGVVPSGYLSDAQTHTLALSLRLAAIRLFNKKTRILVLDDVVTSYDADHRKAIAAMIAKHFIDFQIILVTHDERFFLYLKDDLPQQKWIFKRILNLDKDYGPLFHDHNISDALIEGKLARNEHVANEMRQAEDEWLLRICREFGVDIRIRDLNRPYEYERAELTIALFRFLKEKRIEVPKVQGITNPFLLSLQQGLVENFGSHFTDNPYASGSVGDEKVRWREFKEFRDFFTCPKCGSKNFKRPRIDINKPLCQKCESPFGFSFSVSTEK